MLDPARRCPIRTALILSLLSLPVAAQDASQILLTPTEWTHLRAMIQALSTEEGTRAFFRHTYRLSQSFSSEDHFLEYVAPWRSGLMPLPELQEKASDVVDLNVIEKRDGLSVYVTFFRTSPPPNNLVFLRTTWVNGELLNLKFMKGSSPSRGDS